MWIFRANILIHNQNRQLTYVIKEKNTKKIIGTFTVIPPEGVHKSLSIYSKLKIPYFIYHFGINPLIKMLQIDKYNKKILTDSLKSSRYYYLHMVVVKEEYRGKGVGSFALKYAIDQLISLHPGCNLLGLTTQLPENVTFYSRLGFEKAGEGYISYKDSKYFNWNMKKNL